MRLCLLAFCLFSRHISQLQENRCVIFEVRVVLKTLVSLMGHLEPCSARRVLIDLLHASESILIALVTSHPVALR